jgi:Tfp pilus assembly protein PilV
LNASQSAQTTVISDACTNYQGGQVTLTVPTSGTIVIQSLFWLRIQHTAGTMDRWGVTVGTTPTDCSNGYYWWYESIDSAASTDLYDRSGFVQSRAVVGAGTYTFYLNGWMNVGQSPGDVFFYTNMIAVFYPA